MLGCATVSISSDKVDVGVADLFGLAHWPALPAFLVSTASASGEPHLSAFSLITFSSYTGVAEDPQTPLIVSLIIGDYESFAEVQNSTTYRNIHATGEFVINVPTAALVRKVSRAGVPHADKFGVCELTAEASTVVDAPSVAECPVSVECRLEGIEHRRWLGEIIHGRVVQVRVNRELADEQDAPERMRRLDPLYHYSYDHDNGCFYRLGEMLMEERETD